MTEWDDLRFILALSREKTVRAAAHVLGVTHSTVSRRLAAIQQRQGSHVFDRTAAGYAPTALGSRLISAAEHMEEAFLTAERRSRAAEQQLSGPITVSLPHAIAQLLLLDELVEFSHQYPDIEVTIDSSYMFANLDKSEADIVVRGVDQPPEHYVGRRLFHYGLCEYCAVDYLDNTPAAERRWITWLEDGKPPAWIAHSPFPDVPLGLNITDIDLRTAAAVACHGMIRTACYIGDLDPRLMRVPGAKPVMASELWVLTHPDLQETPRIKALMRFITAVLLKKRRLIEGLKEVT